MPEKMNLFRMVCFCQKIENSSGSTFLQQIMLNLAYSFALEMSRTSPLKIE